MEDDDESGTASVVASLYLCKICPKSLPSVECLPRGISSLLSATSRSTISTWFPLQTNESDVSTDSGPSSEEDVESAPVFNERRKEHDIWDEWNALCSGVGFV